MHQKQLSFWFIFFALLCAVTATYQSIQKRDGYFGQVLFLDSGSILTTYVTLSNEIPLNYLAPNVPWIYGLSVLLGPNVAAETGITLKYTWHGQTVTTNVGDVTSNSTHTFPFPSLSVVGDSVFLEGTCTEKMKDGSSSPVPPFSMTTQVAEWQCPSINSGPPCQGLGNCNYANMTCNCDAGYKAAQYTQFCEDINECVLGNVCGYTPTRACQNTIGNYTCIEIKNVVSSQCVSSQVSDFNLGSIEISVHSPVSTFHANVTNVNTGSVASYTSSTLFRVPSGFYTFVFWSSLATPFAITNPVFVPSLSPVVPNGTVTVYPPTCGASQGIPKGELYIQPANTDAMAHGWSFQINADAIHSPGPALVQLIEPGTYTCRFLDSNYCEGPTMNVTVPANPPLTINAEVTNQVCRGGSGYIDLNATGGSGKGYTFTIGGNSYSATRLPFPVGVYEITVRDSVLCSTSTTVTIVGASYDLEFTETYEPPTCYGQNGTLIVNVQSGQGPFTYIYNGASYTNPDLSVLATGSSFYSVRDSVGCTITHNFWASYGSEIYANVNFQSDPTCPGNADGYFWLDGESGTEPYTYYIDEKPTTNRPTTGYAAGNHTYSVVDASGCGGASGVVTLVDPPKIECSVSFAPVCNSSALTDFTITCENGASSFTFLDANDTVFEAVDRSVTFTGYPPGTYTFRAYDSRGCFAPEVISVNLLPSGPIITLPTIQSICPSSTATVTATIVGGTAPFSYSTDGKTWTPYSNGTTHTFTGLTQGTHTLYARDATCFATPTPVQISTTNSFTVSWSHDEGSQCYALVEALLKVNGVGPFQISVDGEAPVQSQSSMVFTLSAGPHGATVTDTNGCSVTANTTVNLFSIPRLQVHANNIECGAVGSINATIVGGTPPFTFYFNGSSYGTQSSSTKIFGGLSVGTYPVSVTDVNGCSSSNSAEVDNHGLAMEVDVQNPYCYGSSGQISVRLFGGIPPFCFSLNGSACESFGAFTVPAGTYNVSTTDSGSCEVWQIVTLTAPEPLRASYIPDILSNEYIYVCSYSNGSIYASATGGTPPYFWRLDSDTEVFIGNSHNWTSSIPQGNRDIFFSDQNGCGGSVGFIISPNPELQLYVFQSSPPTCYGRHDGFMDMRIDGLSIINEQFYMRNANASLTWSNNTLFDGLSGGNYLVEVMDEFGCYGSLFVNLPEPGSVTINVTNFLPLTETRTTTDLRVSAPGLSDGTVSFITNNNSRTPYSFLSNHTGVYGIFQDPWLNATFSDLEAGTYDFTVLDTGYCEFYITVDIREPTLPSPPSYIALQVNFAQGTITATWDNRPFDGYADLVSFQLQTGQYNAVSGNISWSSIAPVNISAPNNTYTIRATTGVTHAFRVATTNVFFTGNYSEPQKVLMADVPNAPTLYAQVVPETSPGNATVLLRWVPANASSVIGLQYIVYMSKGGAASQIVANYTTDRVMYVYNLVEQTAYEFTVQAIGTTGLQGPISAPITITTLSPPGAPTAVASSSFDRITAGLTLSWTAPTYTGGSSNIQYVIQAALGGYNWRTLDFTTNTSYFVSNATAGLTYGAMYYFRVFSQNEAGKSATAGNVTQLFAAIPLSPLPPTVAQIVLGDANTPSSVTFNLSRPSDYGPTYGNWFTLEYTEQDPTSNSSSWTVVDFITGNQWTGSNFTTGTTYWVRLYSTSSVGQSPAVDGVSFTTAGPPGVMNAPVFGNITMTPTSCSIPLSWTTPNLTYNQPITKYEISVTNNNVTTTYMINAPTMSYIARNLRAGLMTYIAIRAYTAFGSGPYYNASILAIALPPAPLPPHVGSVSISGMQADFNVSFDRTGSSNDGNVTVSYTIYQRSYVTAHGPTANSTWIALDTTQVPIPANYSRLTEVPLQTQAMTYEFVTVARNVLGQSPFGLTSAVQVPAVMAQPTILYADTILASTNSSVLLHWSGDIVAHQYRVDWALVGSTNWKSAFFPSNASSSLGSGQVYGLSNNVSYTFLVTGVLSSGATGATSTNFTVFMGTAPIYYASTLAPTATLAGSTAAITWPAPQYTGFAIQYTLSMTTVDAHTNIQSDTTVIAQKLATNTYSMPLAADTIYFYQVQATNILGSGPVSLPSNTVYLNQTIPTPTGLSMYDSIQLKDGSIVSEVQWTGVTGTYSFLSYQVEMSTDNGTSWQILQSDIPCCYWPLSNLSAATYVTIRMSSVTPFAASSYVYTQPKEIIVAPGSMTRPRFANFTYNAASSSVVVLWDPVSKPGSQEITYKLEDTYSQDQSSWATVVDTYSGLSYPISGLVDNRIYWFRTSAENQQGPGPASPYSALTVGPTPSAPSFVSANVTSGIPLTMQVSWGASTVSGDTVPVEYYVLQWSFEHLGVLFKDNTLVINAAVTTATINNVFSGVKYDISVFALNAVGNGTATHYSTFVEVAPIYAPSQPTTGPMNFVNTSGVFSANFSISWQLNVFDIEATMHDLEYSEDSSNWSDLAELVSSNSSYLSSTSVLVTSVFVNLPTGKTFNVRVRSGNAAGWGPYSEVSTFQTNVAPQMNAINFSIPSEDRKQTVNIDFSATDFDNHPNITYTVLMSATPPGTLQNFVPMLSGSTSRTLQVVLTLGKTYYFRIYATNPIGDGAYSSATYTPAVSPLPVTNVDVLSISDDTALIAFHRPDMGGVGVIGYYVFLHMTFPSFNTTTTYFRMSAYYDMLPTPDGRDSLQIPVSTYAFNAFSVSCINLNELTGEPSNFTNDYFAAYPARFSIISPSSNTILGGATVSILLEAAAAISPRTYCKFGDQVVPNYSWGIAIADEDLPYWDLACVVPNTTQAGDVNFALSFDGQIWSTEPAIFTYTDVPVLSGISSHSGPITGTVISISGENLAAVQSLGCIIGRTMSTTEPVQGDSNSAYCGAPPSDTISLPRLPMSLYMDGHIVPLPYSFHYYNMDSVSVTSISPTMISGDIGKTITIHGSFIDTNDTVVIGLRSDLYGTLQTQGKFIDSNTLSFETIPLPGSSGIWTLIVSLNGGVDQKAFESITLTLQANTTSCDSLNCLSCFQDSSCAWISLGNGQGWCRQNFTEKSDPFSPKKAHYDVMHGLCSDYSFSTEIAYVPQDFIYDSDTKLVVAFVDIIVTMYSSQVRPNGLYYSCDSAEMDVITVGLQSVIMQGQNYSTFYGYYATTTVSCAFMYDGTGVEEFYQFTTYPVTVYTFWGDDSNLGLSAENQSGIVQNDVYVRPNITIANDDYKDFFHMQTATAVQTVNLHILGTSRVHNVTVLLNCEPLASWYYPVPSDMSFDLPLGMDPGAYVVLVLVDSQIQIVRTLYISPIPAFVHSLAPSFGSGSKRSEDQFYSASMPKVYDPTFGGYNIQGENYVKPSNMRRTTASDPVNTCSYPFANSYESNTYYYDPNPFTFITPNNTIGDDSQENAYNFRQFRFDFIIAQLTNEAQTKAKNLLMEKLHITAAKEAFIADVKRILNKVNPFGGKELTSGSSAATFDSVSDPKVNEDKTVPVNLNDDGTNPVTNPPEQVGTPLDDTNTGTEATDGPTKKPTPLSREEWVEKQNEVVIKKFGQALDYLGNVPSRTYASLKKVSLEAANQVAKALGSDYRWNTDSPGAGTRQANEGSDLDENTVNRKDENPPNVPDEDEDDGKHKTPHEEEENTKNKDPMPPPPPSDDTENKPGDGKPPTDPEEDPTKLKKTVDKILSPILDGPKVVGVEAGIALSANRASIFTLPPLPIIGGKWGIDIMFILDLQYYFAGTLILNIGGGVTVYAGGSGSATREASISFYGYGQFGMQMNTLKHYPEQIMETFIITLQGNVQWGFPLLDPECQYAELDLIIGIPVTMVVTIHNHQVEGIEKLDYDFGNGFSRSIEGTFGVTIGLSAHIGCDILGVDVTATVTPTITIGSGDPCFKGFAITLSLDIEVHLVVLTLPFTWSWTFDVYKNSKRAIGMPHAPILLTGTWKNSWNAEAAAYNFAAQRKRADHTVATNQLLMDDIYFHNKFALSPEDHNGEFMSCWISYNDTQSGPQIVFSVYSQSQGWSAPARIDDSNSTLPDDMPSVTTYPYIPQNAPQFIAAWIRVTDAPGAIPQSQEEINITATMKSMELVVSIYDTDSKTWGDITQITHDEQADMAPSIIGYSDDIMVVWYRDNDADPLTRTDRDLLSATFDGIGWFSRGVFQAGVSIKENVAITSSDDFVAVAYVDSVPNPNPPTDIPANTDGQEAMDYGGSYTVFAQLFDTNERTWGDQFSLTQFSNYDQANVTKSRAQIATIDDGYFVASWLHNKTILYKVFSADDQHRSPLEIYTDDSNVVNSISLSSSASHCVITWTVTNPSFSGYFYALMEPGSQSFGAPTFVQSYPNSTSTNLTVDTYSRTALLSVNGSDTPYFMRVYTERDVLLDADTNSTSLGASRLMWDVRELGAKITVSSATFDGQDSNGFLVSISLQNIGTLTLSSDTQSVTVYTGDASGPSGNVVYQQSIPLLYSGSSHTFSFEFLSNAAFEGYLWIEVLDDASSTVLETDSISLVSPQVTSATFTPSLTDLTRVIINAQIENAYPYPIAPVTVPVYVMVTRNQIQSVLQATNVTLQQGSPTTVTFTLSASSITSASVSVVSGISRADFPVSISPNIPYVSTANLPATTPNLVLSDASKVEILDSFAGTVTLNVLVKNNAPIPVTNTTLGVFLESGNVDPSLLNKSLALIPVPFIPPLTELPIQVSLLGWNQTGIISVSVIVNPYQTFVETNYDDNHVEIDIPVWPRFKLAADPTYVVMDETAGTISFALRNMGTTVPDVNISVYHQNSITNQFYLLGNVRFLNVTSTNCQIGTLRGLADVIATNFSVLSNIMLMVPAFFTGTPNNIITLTSANQAQNNTVPDCTVPLYQTPSVLGIPNFSIQLGYQTNLPLIAAVDPTFAAYIGSVGALEVPAFGVYVPGNTPTSAYVRLSPTNADVPRTGASDPVPTGLVQFSAVAGLQDSGVYYSNTTIDVTVLCPVVANVTSASTLGGPVSIVGYNFGSDASAIKVTAGFQEELNCSDVTLSGHGTIVCNMPAAQGTGLPVYVYVGQGKSINDNFMLSFVTPPPTSTSAPTSGSAITNPHKKKGLSGGAIAGIVIGVVVFVAIVVVAAAYFIIKRKGTMRRDVQMSPIGSSSPLTSNEI